MTNTNPTITQTTIYKTLHRKLKIDQHKPHYHSNNHLQNTTQKTKDWPTQTPLSLKQPSTKHYTENKRLTNTNPTITQTTIYKTLHRKLKIDQHEPNYHSNKPSTKHYTENKTLTNTNPTITQTTIYKTLHRKLKIDQHKPHYHSNSHLQNTTQKTKDWPTHEPNYHSNNHLQNITQKTKDWPSQTPLSLKQPSTKHYTEN